MSWVRLDDSIFDNPKIAALSDAAQLAHIKAIVYCSRGLTDGDVPMRKAKEIASAKVIKELVPHLWEPTDTGFRVHDYLEYNPSRAYWEELKQERSKAGSKGAAARWQTDSKDDGKAMANEWQTHSTSPLPPDHDHNPDPDHITERPTTEGRSAVKIEWESRIGVIPKSDLQEFEEYESKMPREWFLQAIDETSRNAKKSPWPYCRKVLDRSYDSGRPPRAAPTKKALGSVAEVLAGKRR